jgi:hypothetical protein
MSTFTYSKSQPGFSDSGFNKSCLAWCKGKHVFYKQFSKSGCHIK